MIRVRETLTHVPDINQVTSAVFVMVISMMEFCHLEFKNVGVVPLLAHMDYKL